MSDKTLEVIGKIAVLLIFLISVAGISVLLEHTILNIAGIDISSGIDFFAGFCFCQFCNYVFNKK